MPICEQCKKKIITAGLSHKEKWFCSLKCLKDYKANQQTQ